VPIAEHTRIDSVEKLKLNAHQLQEQIASIEQEINDVHQTIDRKRDGILEAILKVISFEELIEDIEMAMADELYQFQSKVIAIETQLMNNFRTLCCSDVKSHLEYQLDRLKAQHGEKVWSDDESYAELTKQSKVFAASIGDVVQEYQKFHDERHDKYDYNMDKLKKLLSRPAEFCKDSNGDRFFFNSDNEKVFQDEVHRSQYMLDAEGERMKIEDGKPLETGVHGEFYVDVSDRKIYTKYFFEDEFGRYYIDTRGSRHYQKDPRASEYDLVNGNWVKIKDGTYEVDEKGLRIPDKKEGEDDDDEMVNLVQDLVTGQASSSQQPTKISDEAFKILKEVLGPVVVKACAACYLHQPANPIEYFALFLRNHRNNERMFEQEEKQLKFFTEIRKQNE
jgi:hypothetical protein